MRAEVLVIVLTHNLPRFHGDFSGTFIDALCRALVTQGAGVHVLAPHDSAYQPLPGRTYALHLYRYAWPPSLQTVGYMRSMVGDLKVRRVSLAVTPAMLAAGALHCLRLVRLLHPDVIHAHWLLPNGLIGAVASRLTGVPLVVSIPGSDLLVARSNRFISRLASFVLRQAALVTANSHDLQRVAYQLGADPDRFDLIIYGVDPEALQPDPEAGQSLRRKLGIAAEDFLVLAVGRMVPKKGFRYLLEAMPLLLNSAPRSHLILVGDGPERPDLGDLAQRLQIADRVLFAGTIARHEIPSYYNACDVLAMPSVTEPEDGLNVCVLDAMACAKPVVATTVAGNPLAVQDGLNGSLVPEHDPARLAEELARLAADGELVRRYGAASRRLAEGEFSWPYLARRYLTHFGRLARGK